MLAMKIHAIQLRRLAASFLLLSFAGDASANMGVPMLALTLPAMVVAMLPVIALEAFVLGRMLGTRVISRVRSVAIANVLSTVAGIPFTWAGLFALQGGTGGGTAYGIATPAEKLLAVTWQAPWLIPYEGELYWMVPTASLALLTPFFFASYITEAHVIGHYEPRYSKNQLRPAVFRANLLSYILLAVANLIWLGWALAHAR
jgi:hypothetical protein